MTGERRWGGRIVVALNQHGEISLEDEYGEGLINIRIELSLDDAVNLRYALNAAIIDAVAIAQDNMDALAQEALATFVDDGEE
jgi:hypothetical protein